MEATVVPKRPREEETQVEQDVDSKRHKPYSHILSLLESEEDDSSQDLSPLITTLQQEITCPSTSESETLLSPVQQNDQQNHPLATTTTTTSLEDSNGIVLKEDEEDDKERVMRHLLEASDDELGIPNRGGDGLWDFGEDGYSGGDGFCYLGEGLWELEDETANYYTLLQSELFL